MIKPGKPAGRVKGGSGYGLRLTLAVILMGIVVSCFSTVLAAEPAFVELDVPKDIEPWMGQKFVFAVEVFVAGRFSASTIFNLPQVPEAILIKPEDRPVLFAKTIDDKEYTIQRHEFFLFCQRAGETNIPEILIRCGAVTNPGEPPSEYSLRVPAFSVTARRPDGATPGRVVISTTRLDVSETWDPKPNEAIKVGDAFERKITMRAANLPGMLLPKTPRPQLTSAALYDSPPGIFDRMERGDFTGTRIETLTYVCESPGTEEIPAILFRWWNPSAEAWEEETLPAVTLAITPSSEVSNGAGPVRTVSQGISWRWLSVLVVFLVGGAWALFLRRRTVDAEARSFRELMRACREDHAKGAYNAWTRWRSISSLSTIAPPAGLLSELVSAQQVIVGLQPSWNGRQLGKMLKSWRRKTPGPESHPQLTKLLPELNPED